jgi:hypothetical protein
MGVMDRFEVKSLRYIGSDLRVSRLLDCLDTTDTVYSHPKPAVEWL